MGCSLVTLEQDHLAEPRERGTIRIAAAHVPRRVELLPPRKLAMAVTSVLQILHNDGAALLATAA